jgi:hypothetical protein
VGRKRTCELPFCHGVVEGTKNKRRCDNDRNIHLHQIISKSVRRIMRYLENHGEVTANDVNHDLFKGELDKNEKGSMYRLFQAMVRENYLVECGKKDGLKVYCCTKNNKPENIEEKEEVPEVEEQPQESQPAPIVIERRLSPEEILLGKLREFVHMKSGQWNHEDWVWLLNRPDIREFGMSENDIGRLLEEEKARYWLQRNNY